MSRLIFTERGRILLHANEEIARWRWVRKLLRVDRRVENAELWLFVRPYPQSKEPLEVILNDRRVALLRPSIETSWQWRSIPLPAQSIRRGVNEIILRCGTAAMNAWMLGIENGHANPRSFLSTDRGATWRNQNMGAAGVLRGEYLIRLRAHGNAIGDEPPPPKIVYEDARHPRVKELEKLIPPQIRRIRQPWGQVLALRTWVARAWTYQAFGRCYSPPDPWTVLAWKRGDWGHGYENPIAMCVHYGMVLAASAAALKHDARCVAITQDVNGPHGHFMTEIWDRDLGKWIAHDASYDLHYEIDRPLSAIELADEARTQRFGASMRPGPGFTSKDKRLLQIRGRQLKTGKSFRHVGVWRLNNLISDPSSQPPSHGSVTYCETDFAWYLPAGADELGMFPYRTSARDYFDRPAQR